MSHANVYSVLIIFMAIVKLYDASIEERKLDKVHIKIFYESLCPDSKRYIVDVFYPHYRSLLPYVKVHFVPFGKSNVTESREYYCQHGPLECQGNIIQACTLQRIKRDELKVEYVFCAMRAEAIDEYEQCSSFVGVPWEDVQTCAAGQEGYELMVQAQKETKEQTDGPTFVPSVTYNGLFNKPEQRISLINPTQAVCKYLQKQGNTELCD